MKQLEDWREPRSGPRPAMKLAELVILSWPQTPHGVPRRVKWKKNLKRTPRKKGTWAASVSRPACSHSVVGSFGAKPVLSSSLSDPKHSVAGYKCQPHTPGCLTRPFKRQTVLPVIWAARDEGPNLSCLGSPCGWEFQVTGCSIQVYTFKCQSFSKQPCRRGFEPSTTLEMNWILRVISF